VASFVTRRSVRGGARPAQGLGALMQGAQPAGLNNRCAVPICREYAGYRRRL